MNCLGANAPTQKPSMDTRQITDALNRAFNDEGHRLVFWNDPEREFEDVLSSLALDGVRVLRLDELGALEVKIHVEREDSEGRYLLYSPAEEPDYEDDWLLDIRLYSRAFRADRASIILDELGLDAQHLRQHIAERRKFFDNKDRLQKLKALVTKNDSAADLDRKMMAVVVRADQPELFNIVRTLFHAYTENAEEIDPDAEPAAWEQMAKFDLDEPFWRMIKSEFGYADETPTLKKLLIRLFVTDFAHHLKNGLPASLQNLALPPLARPNAVVCLAQWRDSNSRAQSYDRLSERVAEIIKLEDHLHSLEINQLIDVMSFEAVEKRIAVNLRDLAQNTAETINVEEVREVALRRQSGHWASPKVTADPGIPRQAMHAVYSALVTAAEFYALRNERRQGFEFAEAAEMYRAYEEELYRFDQLYRQFCEAADQAEAKGWSILKPLRDEIEACYVNWYLPNLALAWGRFIDPRGKTALLNNWRIEKIPNQYQFYDHFIKPRLEEAENRKTYVIISDAFRYEAGRELTDALNGRYRFEATLDSQLGVLPSHTALGMAALLPHARLSYKANGEVMADGKPAAMRDEILQAASGMACKADELMKMKKEEGREFVGGKRVVYIYHNVVDAIGDSASTEAKTFDGVRQAIDELADLTAYVINSLNGNHVVITADHGFLFTETPPGEAEKSKLEQKPAGTILAKKRYLIGLNLPDHEAVWHGKTSVTAKTESGDVEMEFWIPKGANRFHFVGGARFIHGGAMLQEIVVPVITVRHVKGKSVKETKTKPAPVQVLGVNHRITTHRHRFELIQMEPVSERVKPVTLKIAVYEGNDPVTNIETMTFDSASDKLDDRKRWISLVLQNRQYDKATSYKLVLTDVETGVEQIIPVTIDRAFSDDF